MGRKIFTAKGERRDSPPTPAMIREQFLPSGYRLHAGTPVNEESSLALTSMRCAVNLIASLVSTLDFFLYERDGGGGQTRITDDPLADLIEYPCTYLNRIQFYRLMMLHAVASGNFYAEIVRDQADGLPLSLCPTYFRNVKVCWDEDTNLPVYHLIKEGRDIPQANMIHISTLGWNGLTGDSPIVYAARSLGVATATEEYASSIYRNGSVPPGFFKLMPGAKWDESKTAEFRQTYQEMHGGPFRAGIPGILEGMDWVGTGFSPVDSDLYNARVFSTKEVSRITGVPANLLHEAEQNSYNSNEEQNIQFLQNCLRSWIENIECEFDTKLIPLPMRRRFFTEFRAEKLLRGNSTTLTNNLKALWYISAVSTNEVRSQLGYNPRPGGDKYFVPNNMMADQADGLTDQTPTPDQAPTPDEAPSATASDAVRDVLRDTAGRLLRRQLAELKKLPGLTTDALVSYYAAHRAFVETALTPAVRAYSAVHGLALDPGLAADRWIEATRTAATGQPERFFAEAEAELDSLVDCLVSA